MENETPLVTKRPIGTFIYAGRVISADKKTLLYRFIFTDKPNDFRPVNCAPADEMFFSGNLKMPIGNPGSFYEMEYLRSGDRTSIFTNTAKLLGRWNNDADVSRWQSESMAAEIAFNSAKSAKRAAGEKVFENDLAKLRKEYLAKRTSKERAAFLAMVIEAITR